MKKNEDLIEKRYGRFKVTDDGIIVGYPTEVDMDTPDAKDMVLLLRQLNPTPGKMQVLLDQRNVHRKLTSGARSEIKTQLQDEVDRIAVLIGNTISRFFASTVLMALGQGDKVRVFESEGQAFAWLRENRSR